MFFRALLLSVKNEEAGQNDKIKRKKVIFFFIIKIPFKENQTTWKKGKKGRNKS